MLKLKLYFLLFSAILTPIGLEVPTRAADSAIHWHNGTLSSAIAEAMKRGLPVFGVFYMPWCGPSQYLLKTTLQDSVLADYINQRTIPITLDGEQFPELFKTYGVHAYPSVLLMSPSGEEIDRVSGAGPPPDVMLGDYRKVIEEGKTPSQLLLELANDGDNPEIMYQLLIKYATRERTVDALAFKVKIEQEHPAYYAKVRAPALFKIADSFFLSRQYDEAISYLKFIIDQVPEADHRRAFEYLSYSYQRSNRINAAFDTLEEAIKIFPSEIRFHFNYLAMAYNDHLRVKKAITYGEQGRLLDLPFYDRAYLCFLVARVYKLDGNLPAARNLINEAIALDPQDEYIEFRDGLEGQ
jgi:tetratricopeptide (TPR) repeat protein